MESFLQHSTNLSFEKMLQQEQAERDNLFSSSFAHINEAANTSFDKIIDDTLQPNERKVFGNYALKPKSFALTIDRRDQKSFIKLFKKAPDKTVGNGEISLYWLFNGKGKKRAYETRGGNEPDLRIDRKAVEVKAYPYHDPISLGRFQDRRLFRSMVNTLFGVANMSNAFQGGTEKGKTTFKGELSFKYKDVLEGAQKLIELKQVIDGNSKALMNFKVFKDMARTIGQFENGLRLIKYKERNMTPNGIAVALMKHLIEVSVGDKPGDKGYIANLKDNKPLDIYFHYIDFKNMKSDEKLLASKGTFSIGGGTIKANFSRLFG